jgi:hypothetical protein
MVKGKAMQMSARRITALRTAGVVAVVAAAGGLALLAGAAPATADGVHAHPSPSPSPSPDPRPDPLWLTAGSAGGGVKTNALPGPGLAVNDVTAHAPGEWYPAGPGSVNPAAERNFVRRDGAGRYTVWFPGLAPAGPVHVAATSPEGGRCAAAGIAPSPGRHAGTDVSVSCAEAAGRGADAAFTVRF